MKNRKLLLIVSLVLALTMSLGGTLAYLTDTDADVNVMTLGNVKIEQHEYERRDEDTTEGYDTIETVRGNSYELFPFSQEKPLLPTTCENPGNLDWDTTKVYFAQLADKAPEEGDMHWYGTMDMLKPEVTNAVDKFVFVENTGNTDAYVRTIIAFEAGSYSVEEWNEWVMTNANGYWKYTTLPETVVIDGNNYVIMVCDYDGNFYRNGQKVEGNTNARHPDGIVHAGDWTYNNLAQVYIVAEADNEQLQNLDGNKNGTYDILVVSQAVQAAGFVDAETALDEAFGDVTTTSHPWRDGQTGDQEPDQLPIPKPVSSVDELVDALAEGGNVLLTKDITVDEPVVVPAGVIATLNLNGKTITGTMAKSVGHVLKNEGTLTVEGGTIKSTAANGGSAIYNAGKMTITGATIVGAPLEGESWPSYPVNNYGEMKIADSTVEGFHGGIAINNGAELVVDNTTVQKKYCETSSHVFYIYGEGSKLTVNSGKFQHDGFDGSLCYTSAGTSAVINGGTFTYANGGYGVAALGNSNVTINGGDIQQVLNWGGTIIDNRTAE